jgi:hypothetical protein
VDIGARKNSFFSAALLALGSALVLLLAFTLWPSGRPARVAPAAAPEAVAVPIASVPAAPAQPSACPSVATVTAKGPGDGRFAADAALSVGQAVAPRAFLSVAKEASREGRPRDAEVALIVACRLAAGEPPAASVALADIQQALGEHYAAAAAAEPLADVQTALRQRAQQMLAASSSNYVQVLGGQASKSRLAAKRLESVEAARQPADAGAASDTALADTAGDSTAVLGAAANADEELVQLESDLSRLGAQAASVTADPARMQRRSEQAAARRNACGTKDCLLQWYAQRRRELLEEF